MSSRYNSEEEKRLRAQLEAYLREHAPSRTADVDVLLLSGIPESELWRHVEKRYAKERADTARQRRRLTAFYQQHAPAEVGKVQALLERRAEEGVLFDALYKKYKIPVELQLYGSAAQEHRRKELALFFAKRLGEVPSWQQEAAVEAAMNSDLPLDKLLHQLRTQHSLDAEASLALEAVEAQKCTNEQQEEAKREPQERKKKKKQGGIEDERHALHQRLTEFYSTHCPSDVDAKVRYAMSLNVDETVLFASLHRRYNLDAEGNPLPPDSSWSRRAVDVASVASSTLTTTPSAAAAAAAASSSTRVMVGPEREPLRQRLIAFYEKHNPLNMEAKVQRALELDVDEEELFRALRRQYHLNERGEPITRAGLADEANITDNAAASAEGLLSFDHSNQLQNDMDVWCDTRNEEGVQLTGDGEMQQQQRHTLNAATDSGVMSDTASPPPPPPPQHLRVPGEHCEQTMKSLPPAEKHRRQGLLLFSHHTRWIEGGDWKGVCTEKLREAFLSDFAACSGNTIKEKAIDAVVRVEVNGVRVGFFVPWEDPNAAQALDDIVGAASFPAAWRLLEQQEQQQQHPKNVYELDAGTNEGNGDGSLCVVVDCMLERINCAVMRRASDAQRSFFIRALEVDLLSHAVQYGASHLAMGSRMTLCSDRGLELCSEVHFSTKEHAEAYVCALLEDNAVYCREARKTYALLGGDPYDVAVAVVSPLPAVPRETSPPTPFAASRERMLVYRESQLLAWEKRLREWQRRLQQLEASVVRDLAAVNADGKNDTNGGGIVGCKSNTRAMRLENTNAEQRAILLASEVKTRLKTH